MLKNLLCFRKTKTLIPFSRHVISFLSPYEWSMSKKIMEKNKNTLSKIFCNPKDFHTPDPFIFQNYIILVQAPKLYGRQGFCRAQMEGHRT